MHFLYPQRPYLCHLLPNLPHYICLFFSLLWPCMFATKKFIDMMSKRLDIVIFLLRCVWDLVFLKIDELESFVEH